MMTPENATPSSLSAQPTPPGGELVGLDAATSRPAGYIPVVEETLTVGKRMVETGQVRLIKTVHQDEQTVQIPLVADQIMVERVLINELVDEPPTTRQEGDTVIYPVLKEEYVLVKRLRLVEEIRVTTRQIITTENQTVSLRREEISIERTTVDHPNERSDLSRVDTPDESPLIDQSIL